MASNFTSAEEIPRGRGEPSFRRSPHCGGSRRFHDRGRRRGSLGRGAHNQGRGRGTFSDSFNGSMVGQTPVETFYGNPRRGIPARARRSSTGRLVSHARGATSYGQTRPPYRGSGNQFRQGATNTGLNESFRGPNKPQGQSSNRRGSVVHQHRGGPMQSHCQASSVYQVMNNQFWQGATSPNEHLERSGAPLGRPFNRGGYVSHGRGGSIHPAPYGQGGPPYPAIEDQFRQGTATSYNERLEGTDPRRGLPSNRGRGGAFHPRGGALHHDFRDDQEQTPEITRPMGMRFLQRLLEQKHPYNILELLHKNKKPLELFLESDIDDEKMDLIIQILGTAYESSGKISLKAEDILCLLDDTCFLDKNLVQWIPRWKDLIEDEQVYGRNLSLITELLRNMLRAIPTSVKSIGVVLALLKEAVAQITLSAEVTKKLDTLCEEHLIYLQKHLQANSYGNTTPPDDFRNVPILPIPCELRSDYKPFLRKNIVNGNYQDVDHYLDIHFRLLREDFVQPLREGITEYLTEMAKNRPQTRRRFQNVRLYRNVRAVSVSPTSAGLSYVLQFEVEPHLRRVKWDVSRRLIYGSLVCLSKDNFETLLVGVVSNRNQRRLQAGFVEVMFHLYPALLDQLFSCSFLMAESSSYFEAYRHVLNRLQSLDGDNFPFQQYIIHSNSQPNFPSYVLDHPGSRLVLESEMCLGETTNQLQDIEVSVCSSAEWPEAEILGFDESQMEAFRAALSEELCLIQGPPGTGKTYVGLRIVKTLLANRKKFGNDKPLLVICYTNHALDQFLEGILEFEDNLVRIGGRSKSAMLVPKNIKHVRGRSDRHLYGAAMRDMEARADVIRECQLKLELAKNKLIRAKLLENVMTIPQKRCLRTDYGIPIDPTLQWLHPAEGWLKIHPRQRRLPSVNDPTANSDAEVRDSTYEYENRYIDDRDNTLISHRSSEHDMDEEFIMTTELQKAARTVTPMNRQEASKVCDVWKLSAYHRWRLYRYWVQCYTTRIQRKLYRTFSGFELDVTSLNEMEQSRDLRALELQSVIGMTTTGAAKYTELLQKLGPTIVVVEEAAEVLEANIITSLCKNTQHLILIGDHQQLRPNPTVYSLCKNYNLDISLFERLLNNGMSCHRLTMQHRMRPEISHTLKLHDDFYPDLLDHRSVHNYGHVMGIEKDVYFVEHSIAEQHDNESMSHSNKHEARFLAALCKYVIQQGYDTDQITILTAYKGQERTIKQAMLSQTFESVHVCPIDNFQGEENDIILVSFVRSNDEGSIGFLKVSNRVCVALSRARMGFYCIGNFSLLSKQSAIWKTITEDLKTRELIGPRLKLICSNHPGRTIEVSEEEDFQYAPDGGCMVSCDARLDCGHTCQMKCHPRDRKHGNIRCGKPCEKVISQCGFGHICQLKCWQECPEKCNKAVTKTLPCSHELDMPCHEDPKCVRYNVGLNKEIYEGREDFRFLCREPCARKLSCGHRCGRRCFQKCRESNLCMEFIDRKFETCGHDVKSVFCSLPSCPSECKERLSCGHVCRGTCSECSNGRFHKRCTDCKNNVSVLVCDYECSIRISLEFRTEHTPPDEAFEGFYAQCALKCLSECRHGRRVFPCGSGCNREPCNEPCDKYLLCGHACIGLCGEHCPSLCRTCNEVELKLMLSETDDVSNARFVLLEECNHVVEMKTCEKLIKNNKKIKKARKPLNCPQCKTPIRYSRRNNKRPSVTNEDVHGILEETIGAEGIESSLSKLDKDCRLHCSKNYATGSHSAISNMSNRWLNGRYSAIMRNSINVHHTFAIFCKDRTLLNMLIKLHEVKDQYATYTALYGYRSSLSETNYLTKFEGIYEFLVGKMVGLIESRDAMTRQQAMDWVSEYTRYRFGLSLLRVIGLFKENDVSLEEHSEEKTTVDQIERTLYDGCRYTEEKVSEVRGLLVQLENLDSLLKDQEIAVTEQETAVDVRLISFIQSKWTKCSKGHLYALKDFVVSASSVPCRKCRTEKPSS